MSFEYLSKCGDMPFEQHNQWPTYEKDFFMDVDNYEFYEDHIDLNLKLNGHLNCNNFLMDSIEEMEKYTLMDEQVIYTDIDAIEDSGQICIPSYELSRPSGSTICRIQKLVRVDLEEIPVDGRIHFSREIFDFDIFEFESDSNTTASDDEFFNYELFPESFIDIPYLGDNFSGFMHLPNDVFCLSEQEREEKENQKPTNTVEINTKVEMIPLVGKVIQFGKIESKMPSPGEKPLKISEVIMEKFVDVIYNFNQYHCFDCGKGLKNLYQLILHYEEERLFDKLKFKCVIRNCPFHAIGFERKMNLRKHIISQHFNKEKQMLACHEDELNLIKELLYFCDGCEGVFYRKDTLKRHEKLHQKFLSKRRRRV